MFWMNLAELVVVNDGKDISFEGLLKLFVTIFLLTVLSLLVKKVS